MPRVAKDMNGKITALESKIEKKQSEIKKLREDLAQLKEKKNQADNKALFEYMTKNKLSAEDVLSAIKN